MDSRKSSISRSSRRFYRTDSQGDLAKYMDHGEHFANQNRWVFECAWEVANKVGGIYTVLRSKTGVSVNEMGDQYVLLGKRRIKKAHNTLTLTLIHLPQARILS